MRILNWFNSLNMAVLIFISVILNFAGFNLLGGEEQYLAFSKQFVSHNWMPYSFNLNHPAEGNILFQVLIGFILKFISFEWVAFLGRVICFWFISDALSRIFKHFKLGNIGALFLVVVLFIPNQSIWAGEWLFQNFEPKVVAYIFLFYGVYFYLNKNLNKSFIFLVISTYFHFLVGGWMVVFLVIHGAISKIPLKKLIRTTLIYATLISPLFIFIVRTYFLGGGSVINGVNINWVYSMYRLKHHIGMFGDLSSLSSNFTDGILISLGFFLLCVIWLKKYTRNNLGQLNLLNIIILMEQFVFIGVGIFDKNGVLMKTYPFRSSMLTSLLFKLELVLLLKTYTIPWILLKMNRKQGGMSELPVLKGIILAMTMFVLTLQTIDSIKTKNISDEVKLEEKMELLLGYVGRHYNPDDVFLFLDDDKPYSFMRKTNRNRFAVNKFTPTHSEKIYEWYIRLRLKEKLREDIEFIEEITKEYKVDYLISKRDFLVAGLKKEKEFGSIKLYRVTNIQTLKKN